MESISNGGWLLTYASIWIVSVSILRWRNSRFLIHVVWIATCLFLAVNLAVLLFHYEVFQQAGWISIDGIIALVGGAFGWSLIACVMVDTANHLRKFLPPRLSRARLVTLPLTIDALSSRRFVLAETIFLMHGALVCCLWFAGEISGPESWLTRTTHYFVSYLDWPLYLLNRTLWSKWGEENIFAGTMLSSLIFGTAIYTFLGWFVEVFVSLRPLHQRLE